MIAIDNSVVESARSGLEEVDGSRGREELLERKFRSFP